MAKCKEFRTFKERGEWVELKFMAKAAEQGLQVLKPWGDSLAYDVGLDPGLGLLRVQVKSTNCFRGAGYRCRFAPGANSLRRYTAKEIDFFAAYVIPKEVWYLIPSAELFRNHQEYVTLCPTERPRHPERYRYECFREAWALLRRGRCVNCRLMKEAGEVEDE